MRKLGFACCGGGAHALAELIRPMPPPGIAILGLGAAAQDFSPVETVGCRTAGPVCRLGRTWVCRPLEGLLVCPLLALGPHRTQMKAEAAP